MSGHTNPFFMTSNIRHLIYLSKNKRLVFKM
ncbi:hypothetical protein NC653_015306 [Populus alba x Populus x berolinensis]|uniref:Uncharacterized protein n=1 Tax=Populus alba x Populus x berolinensis TaxID=444605 RepID=A0AAD6QKC3_9ROSI|nr:hypothetical protein NC653_015306 [Populus alba x Populus x berolinensis]